MAALTRNVAFTSQMLGFAHTQLVFLDFDLNVFQQRVVKHAFIAQTVNAFLSYLEEIDLLSSKDLPLVNLTAFLRSRLQAQTGTQDSRAEEIRQLLFGNNMLADNTWLLALLSLYEQSQHTTFIEKKNRQDTSKAQSNVIVAVAEEARAPLWWDHDRKELEALLVKLETLIARQREESTEA